MTESKDNNVLILDIPVPHRGYIDFLKKYAAEGNIKVVYLIGEDVLDSIKVPKETRANDPEITRSMLSTLGLSFDIRVLGLDEIEKLPKSGILTARDTVSRKLRERFFPTAQVSEETAFLRWDEDNVTSVRPALIDKETSDPFHISMIERARELADNSSDWWRQVAAVVVRDGRVLIEAYSQAYPTVHNPYIDGNPRDFIQAGTLGFLGKTVHAEQSVIALAAGKGLSLEGADLYLNSFPCPPCAFSMALAGIRRCFAAGGNAYLDTAETLKALKIETYFVRED